MYVTLGVIRNELVMLWGIESENNKMKNSCKQWDSNPLPPAF